MMRPVAGVAQHVPDRRDQQDGEVDHRGMAEEDRPRDRDGPACLREEVGDGGEGRAGIAHAQKRRETDPEERQREPRGDLVRQKNLRQDAEDGRRIMPPPSREEGQRDASGFGRDDEAGDRADDHHALDAEVEDAGLLDHELADGRQQNGRGHDDQGDDEGDGIDQHSERPQDLVAEPEHPGQERREGTPPES
jgi:hypothetical protein